VSRRVRNGYRVEAKTSRAVIPTWPGGDVAAPRAPQIAAVPTLRSGYVDRTVSGEI